MGRPCGRSRTKAFQCRELQNLGLGITQIASHPCEALQLSIILPALLQKLVGEFFCVFAKKFVKFGGKFVGNLLTHRIKAQKYRGKFWGIFRKRIRSSKKSFVQNSLCTRATLIHHAGPCPCLPTLLLPLISPLSLLLILEGILPHPLMPMHS